MKEIRNKLISLFEKGYCTPQIARLAKKLKTPSTTLHYNIKKLEKDGIIKTYKAVLDYKKINRSFSAFVLISISPDEYNDPAKFAIEYAKHDEVESVDVCTGDWEVILKVHVKDQDEYYEFMKNVVTKKGVGKIITLTSLKQLKREFVSL
tara:strand:+ start:2731 stop:3180 length:450 start_codon:yes stop_codon:yes gene_type:complete